MWLTVPAQESPRRQSGNALRGREQRRERSEWGRDRIAEGRGSGEHVVVGLNRYVDEGPPAQIETHKTDPDVERQKIAQLQSVRTARDKSEVRRTLALLVATAERPDENLMPATIAAVRARASMGEIVNALKEQFGVYRETVVF